MVPALSSNEFICHPRARILPEAGTFVGYDTDLIGRAEGGIFADQKSRQAWPFPDCPRTLPTDPLPS